MFIIALSAFLLIVSGLAITVAGGYLSVIGITMFIPDPHIFSVLILLAIAFEVAKITASTFLFHEAKDKSFPFLFKVVLLALITALMVLSAITTFSHLNASANKNLTSTKFMYSELESLKKDKERAIALSNNIDNRIREIPQDLDPKKRVVQVEKLEKERNAKEDELRKINDKINVVSEKINGSDDFAFLNSLSEILGYERQMIFTYGIIFIVLLIDPLAISLILAGTFLIEKARALMIENRKKKEEISKIIESQKEILQVEEEIKHAIDILSHPVEKNIQVEEVVPEVVNPVVNRVEEVKDTKLDVVIEEDDGNKYVPRKKKKNAQENEVTEKSEEKVKEPTPVVEILKVKEQPTEEVKEVEVQQPHIVEEDKNELAKLLNTSIANNSDLINGLYSPYAYEDVPLNSNEPSTITPPVKEKEIEPQLETSKKKIIMNTTFNPIALQKSEKTE